MQIPINLYAIKVVRNDEVIWNARGGAYRDLNVVGNKLKKLKKQNPDNTYEILCWTFTFGIPVVF